MWKENTCKPSKVKAAKKLSLVCMLLVLIALKNVLYSIWWQEDIIFHNKFIFDTQRKSKFYIKKKSIFPYLHKNITDTKVPI